MTLMFPVLPNRVVLDKPRLHALVIGVADYPHLPGGSGAQTADPLNLDQVTTPEFTARAISDWLLTKYNNPATPLGSVELLLSAPSAVAQGLDPATMANIKKAVARWLNRASADPENIALLYFCGHGLTKDDVYLLPEDFGDPAFSTQWENCINFDGLRLGLFASCKAERQILFVDACRATPFSVLTKVNVEGSSLVGGDIYGNTVQTQAVYSAATEGKQAYGPPTDVTYFGQAVVKCLDGLGAAADQGWAVDTHALSAALGKVMAYLGTKNGERLQCDIRVAGKSALLHHPAAPKVLTSIGCSSPAATAAVDIVLQRAAEIHHAGVGDPKPLEREVAPGEWQVTLQFPNGLFQPPAAPFSLTLAPPLFIGVPHP